MEEMVWKVSENNVDFVLYFVLYILLEGYTLKHTLPFKHTHYHHLNTLPSKQLHHLSTTPFNQPSPCHPTAAAQQVDGPFARKFRVCWLHRVSHLRAGGSAASAFLNISFVESDFQYFF